MNQLTCTQCGSAHLEEGFVADHGNASKLYAQWVGGPIRLGLLGFAKLAGRPTAAIVALRCSACSHLELFATAKPTRRA
jgi:hypothetical protein